MIVDIDKLFEGVKEGWVLKSAVRNGKNVLECINDSICPEQKDILNAFKLFSIEETNVFVLGQDPYSDVGNGNGLAFSVKEKYKKPDSSLVNIFAAVDKYLEKIGEKVEKKR